LARLRFRLDAVVDQPLDLRINLLVAKNLVHHVLPTLLTLGLEVVDVGLLHFVVPERRHFLKNSVNPLRTSVSALALLHPNLRFGYPIFILSGPEQLFLLDIELVFHHGAENVGVVLEHVVGQLVEFV